MLQQTQVAAVIPHFKRWMRRFPDVGALARALESEVLRHWTGLGYYARARNLHQAARAIASRGAYPATAVDWQALPGIGKYTAGAIASFAFNFPEPVLDGNVTRVLSRLLGLCFLPGDGREESEAYWDLARLWARGRNPGDANEALMELGALVCSPATPHCEECPLALRCRAKARGWQTLLPPAKRRSLPENIAGVALVAIRRGRVLMELRAGSFLAGHLSFPLFLGEKRRMRKEMTARFPDMDPGSGEMLGEVRHAIMHRRYILEVRRIPVGASTRDAPTGMRWIPRKEFPEVLTNSLTRKIWNITV